MKTTLFSKAVELQKYLKETGTGHNKIYFRFEFGKDSSNDISTIISIEENKTIISCDCKAGSIHYEAICSHKLAVIFFMFKKQMKRLGIKWQK